jgi:hypothetical protein
MTREALADRIITYCDALVAFSLVNGLAFLVALGEPDIRCSIAEISGFILFCNGLVTVAASCGLVALRRAEKRFRGDETRDEAVERFWAILHRVRFGLIWLFSGIVLLGIVGATRDPGCGPFPL